MKTIFWPLGGGVFYLHIC